MTRIERKKFIKRLLVKYDLFKDDTFKGYIASLLDLALILSHYKKAF